MAVMDDATRRKIIALYQGGQDTVAEISEKTGRSPSTIYWILQQNGVMPSRTHKQPPKETRQGEEVVTLDWTLRRIASLERENGALLSQLADAEAAIRVLLKKLPLDE